MTAPSSWTPERRARTYNLSMVRSDERRIRALAAALSEQAGGIKVGPAAAVRWAIDRAERLLGLRGTGPGASSPIGGPAPEDPRACERGTGPGTATPLGGPKGPNA